MMQKTTIYLDSDDYARLKARARREHRPPAELIREAVAVYARGGAAMTRPRSIGAGRSGRSDLAERAEELLDGMGRE